MRCKRGASHRLHIGDRGAGLWNESEQLRQVPKQRRLHIGDVNAAAVVHAVAVSRAIHTAGRYVFQIGSQRIGRSVRVWKAPRRREFVVLRDEDADVRDERSTKGDIHARIER